MRIIKVAKGNYKYVIDVGIDPQTGKRKRLSKGGFPREKDARAAAAEAAVCRDQNRLVLPQKVTFANLAADWLSMYSALGKKPGSIRIRAHYIDVLKPYLGELPIQQLTKKQYQDIIFSLAKRFALNTLSGIHATARMIFKEARKQQLIYEDPTEFAILPRPAAAITEKEELPHYLERDELLRFLSAARENGLFGDYTLFTTLAFTGLRIGELLALTWDDIDLTAGTLRVNKTMYNPDNNMAHYTLVAPKTKRSRRTLDLDAHTVALLSAQKLELNKLRLLYGPMWYIPADFPSGFVFPSMHGLGKPMTQKLVQLRIDRLLSFLDPPLTVRLTPHVFRHTHTSLMAEAGVSLEQIQNRLGHSNDETTRAIYLHITKTRKKDAVDKFAAFMQC